MGTPKTIVLCRSIAACAMLYQMFDFGLREGGYIPEGNIDIKNALFGMFHSKITDEEKRTLTKSFMDDKGTCRVLFSTIAVGTGINIPNIRRVIHNGPAAKVDQYVQETGRGGRDGDLCEVVLYLFSGCTRGKVCDEMKDYCYNNVKCRRKVLMQCFPGEIQFPSGQLHRSCLCNCTCSCGCDKRKTPCMECCSCVPKCAFVSSAPIYLEKVSEDEESLIDYSTLQSYDDYMSSSTDYDSP